VNEKHEERGLRQGLVQVYTGDGKGKTTAAFGLALRAVGAGFRVLMVQFLKTVKRYGEIEGARRLAPQLKVVQHGTPCSHPEYTPDQCEECRACHTVLSNPQPADLEAAREGLRFGRDEMLSGRWDIVILDEINIAARYGIVPVADVLRLIDDKPAGVELILTGRGAPAKLIERADYVTEMRHVKHPYDRGIIARKGIEY